MKRRVEEVGHYIFLYVLAVLYLFCASDITEFFDSAFIWFSLGVFFLGAGVACYLKGRAGFIEALVVFNVIEWLFSYGHSGIMQLLQGIVLLGLFWAKALILPNAKILVAYVVLISAVVCVQSSALAPAVARILLAVGLSIISVKNTFSLSVWSVLGISGSAVLAVSILKAEYLYFQQGVIAKGVVHPHFLSTVVLLLVLLVVRKGALRGWVSFTGTVTAIGGLLWVWCFSPFYFWEEVWGYWNHQPLLGVRRETLGPSLWHLQDISTGVTCCALVLVLYYSFSQKQHRNAFIGLWSFTLYGGMAPSLVPLVACDLNNVQTSSNTKATLRARYGVGVLIAAVLCVLFYPLTSTVQAPHSKDITVLTKLKTVVPTLLAAEDLLFFKHNGIDLARAKWTIRDTLRSGRFNRGASTITMQLVKVRHLSYEKNVLRKIRQFALAIWYELVYSKENIIEMYLNVVSFGPYLQGIKRASQYYFHKDPQHITVEEAEKLVLTIENPLAYTPLVKIMPPSIRKRLVALRRARSEFAFNT
jgi:hypothetical protein